jgi:hypothetical protein
LSRTSNATSNWLMTIRKTSAAIANLFCTVVNRRPGQIRAVVGARSEK